MQILQPTNQLTNYATWATEVVVGNGSVTKGRLRGGDGGGRRRRRRCGGGAKSQPPLSFHLIYIAETDVA